MGKSGNHHCNGIIMSFTVCAQSDHHLHECKHIRRLNLNKNFETKQELQQKKIFSNFLIGSGHFYHSIDFCDRLTKQALQARGTAVEDNV